MTVLETQDIYIRALCIWREMRGETAEARLACYWVICNRMLDRLKRWPKTAYDVVTQPWQFSSFNQGDANSWLFPRRGTDDWQAWLEICAMCDRPGPDPTAGATHYECIEDGKPRPKWAEASKLVKTIGKTRFYRL